VARSKTDNIAAKRKVVRTTHWAELSEVLNPLVDWLLLQDANVSSKAALFKNKKFLLVHSLTDGLLIPFIL